MSTITQPIDDMSDLEVYFYVKDALDYLLEFSFEGARWLERLPNITSYTGMPIRFRGVSDGAVGAPLRRLYLKVLNAPGQFGVMGTGAAANDPLFWVMHPLFEKAWQVLRLAPAFEGFNTTWVNKLASGSTCNGTGWREETPFSDLFDAGPAGKPPAGRYTNEQLWALFDPLGDDLTYVYDQYTSWGDCAWDPWGSTDGEA